MTALNEKDILLMTYFRRNSRMPLTRISRKTNIPVSTIHDKLRCLEKEIITKHTTLIDFRKVGFELKVNMLLKTPEKEKVQAFLENESKVNTVFRITGEYNFMAECIFRNIQELNNFADRLERFDISEKKEFFVVEEVKRESFLCNEIGLLH